MLGFTINHRIKLNAEEASLMPPGEVVSVNDKNIHVYIEGDGEDTLVFMAGHGTSSPMYDFKPLWSEFKDDYKIAVVEKSGYGFSDISGDERDIDTLLEETRQALDKAGLSAPYVLMAHSMSGLEAIRWAQLYPTEIKAIIGLDPAVPEAYDLIELPSNAQLGMMRLITGVGFSRLMPKEDLEKTLPLLSSDVLSNEEKTQYQSLFYKRSLTKDMVNEAKAIRSNVETVSEAALPTSTPMHFFISSEQDELLPGWQTALTDFLSNLDNHGHTVLETGHYVHHEKSETIAAEIRTFLDALIQD